MLAAHVETSPAESPMQKRHGAFTLPPTFLTITPRLPFVYPRPGTQKCACHRRRRTRARCRSTLSAQLPRHGVTSLEDSHLPNCVPVYLFCAGTYLDYAMRTRATARERRIGPSSIPSTDDRDRCLLWADRLHSARQHKTDDYDVSGRLLIRPPKFSRATYVEIIATGMCIHWFVIYYPISCSVDVLCSGA